MKRSWLWARLSSIRTVPTEFMGLFGLAYWAVVIGLPFKTFPTSKTYRVMAAAMPEACWAATAALIVIVNVVGVISGNVRVRRATQLLLTAWWFVIACCFFWSNPLSPSPGPYISLAACGIWAYWKVPHDAD